MKAIQVGSFDEWRRAARMLLQEKIRPDTVLWSESANGSELFGEPFAERQSSPSVQTMLVPSAFLPLAKIASCYRYMGRWALLYRVLWRLTHGESHLLQLDTDDDVRRLRLMEKAIRRDIHKMHAFVRFRRVEDDLGERFVAWYQPAHYVVEEATPFFARRFGAMAWSILTPDKSAIWDRQTLRFGPGLPREAAPSEDELETLWKRYYSSIFNPARVNPRVMKAHMAPRFWSTLPEAQMIPSLLQKANARVQDMTANAPSSATPFVPVDADLATLQQKVQQCRGCPLFQDTTQAVFGEGPRDASIMLVGEQPGDHEDVAGRPFVGPAGQVLDRALVQAGIDRATLYVTNAVKHFKHERTGRGRIHKKPSGSEIRACRPWLEAELAQVKPRLIVCLGASAAQSMLGRVVKINDERGRLLSRGDGTDLLVTVHPSYLLRLPDPALQAAEFDRFVTDLSLIREHFVRAV